MGQKPSFYALSWILNVIDDNQSDSIRIISERLCRRSPYIALVLESPNLIGIFIIASFHNVSS